MGAALAALIPSLGQILGSILSEALLGDLLAGEEKDLETRLTKAFTLSHQYQKSLEVKKEKSERQGEPLGAGSKVKPPRRPKVYEQREIREVLIKQEAKAKAGHNQMK